MDICHLGGFCKFCPSLLTVKAAKLGINTEDLQIVTSFHWLIFILEPFKLSKGHFAYCSSKREARLRDLNVVFVIRTFTLLWKSSNTLSDFAGLVDTGFTYPDFEVSHRIINGFHLKGPLMII